MFGTSVRARSIRAVTAVVLVLLTALVRTAGPATAASYTVTVLSFGATPNDATDDTAAIQRANDDVAAHGGGTVLFPAGTYLASGVWQDSYVEFRGLSGSTLKQIAGAQTPTLQARRRSTTGTTTAGSNVVTVGNGSSFPPGSFVAIRGAGGASATQVAGVAKLIDAASTEITFGNAYGFSNGSTYQPNYLLVGNEVVSYRTLAGNTATGVVRGQFGTRAEPHDVYTPISQLLVHYSHVTSSTKTTLVLADPTPFGVSNVTVYGGSTGMSVHGLAFDGNRQADGSAAPFSILWANADASDISGNQFTDAEGGAIRLDMGTQHVSISNNTFTNNGTTGVLGAAIWFFRGSESNTASGNTITSNAASGIVVDDRTVQSTEWDRGSDGNVISGNTVDIVRTADNSAIAIYGSSDNAVRDNTLRQTYYGVRIFTDNQSRLKVETARNTATGNSMSSHYYGIWADGSSNSASGNTMSGVTKPYVDLGTNNHLGA